MHHIRLHPPVVTGQKVSFRWTVEPATPLYRKTDFYLEFPPSVDLARTPPELWCSIAMICLHAQWPLLRPCAVHLPFQLRPGEKAFWERLLEAATWTLEAYHDRPDPGGAIDLVEEGPPLKHFTALPDTGRCATSFSSGKDSLLQAGLLTELTARPILVATTSPMPPLEDHVTSRRAEIFRAITARRDLTFVEVASDLRSSWENSFASQQGYAVAINELTDTFLYFSSLLAAGVALGANHLFLASETEVQENIRREGRIVQHHHFMYATTTQRAMQALLAPLGIRYCSLTSPLHSGQVQELLWTRYADLRDLQYSCWQVRTGQATCSRCSQCLRIALKALALRDTPARMGIDLITLFQEMLDWKPRPLPDETRLATPAQLVSRQLHDQLIRELRATAPCHVLAAMVAAAPVRFLHREGWQAFRAYRNLRRNLAGEPVTQAPGYRTKFLAQVDPLLRGKLAAIFAGHFPEEKEADYLDVWQRGNELAGWLSEPLAAADAAGAAAA